MLGIEAHAASWLLPDLMLPFTLGTGYYPEQMCRSPAEVLSSPNRTSSLVYTLLVALLQVTAAHMVNSFAFISINRLKCTLPSYKITVKCRGQNKEGPSSKVSTVDHRVHILFVLTLYPVLSMLTEC